MRDSGFQLASGLGSSVRGLCSLGSVCLVVHKKEVEVAGVIDEECLVAGRHHVAGSPVAAKADL